MSKKSSQNIFPSSLKCSRSSFAPRRLQFSLTNNLGNEGVAVAEAQAKENQIGLRDLIGMMLIGGS